MRAAEKRKRTKSQRSFAGRRFGQGWHPHDLCRIAAGEIKEIPRISFEASGQPVARPAGELSDEAAAHLPRAYQVLRTRFLTQAPRY